MKLKYTIMILVSTENERVQRGNSVIIIKSWVLANTQIFFISSNI
jgi:hypothetical protein